MNNDKELLDLLSSLELHVNPLANEDRKEVYAAYSRWMGAPMAFWGYLGDLVFVMHGEDVIYAGPPSGVRSAALQFADRVSA